MPSGTQPPPGPLSRAISSEIRVAMVRRRVSGAQLARMTGRSQSYISKRLRNDASFTSNDIEDILTALEVDLTDFVFSVVEALRRR